MVRYGDNEKIIRKICDSMSFKHVHLSTEIILIVADFVYNLDFIFHLAWIDSKGFFKYRFQNFQEQNQIHLIFKYTKLLQILLRQLSLGSEHFDVYGSGRLKIFLFNRVRKKNDQLIYMFTYFNWRTKNETYK